MSPGLHPCKERDHHHKEEKKEDDGDSLKQAKGNAPRTSATPSAAALIPIEGDNGGCHHCLDKILEEEEGEKKQGGGDLVVTKLSKQQEDICWNVINAKNSIRTKSTWTMAVLRCKNCFFVSCCCFVSYLDF